MILVIGGVCQGKTEAAEALAAACGGTVVDDIHLRIREDLEKGLSRKETEERILELLSAESEPVAVAAEIGCGIVPADAFEREYRETAGRILCTIAGKASAVYRVMAGISVKIKG
ncbi:MAG TPA: bifunctional adenosylcobinamide kinase/adenosylcobinamide-phosphate guanylyltransferase [Firmicutes bacterium]|nr:bifunctional adenosylcobinamide kinase/adenosylcobinamide-phosphate guanylyltransferase [Bacillota bacterium]